MENGQSAVPSSDNEASRTFKDKLLSYIWDSDAHMKTPFERRLIRKLDFGILVVSCLGFFMRYLDSANLANAYVSGMKEDLNILGNEYTYVWRYPTFQSSHLNVSSLDGYMLYNRICTFSNSWNPHRHSSETELLSVLLRGAFTFAQAGARHSNYMYAFRFCVGMFEAPFFPCILYLMGSWYNKYEMAKRIAIFHLCGSLGSSFGGYLQTAVYETLDGARGIAGWRWLYIVCGCMTVPCGIAVLCFLPDLPSNTRAFYLTEEEKKFALDRAIALGKVEHSLSLISGMPLITKIVSSGGEKFYSSLFQSGYDMLIDIQSEAAGYSVAERNVIPSCSRLISAFCIFVWGFGSDLTGSRFAFVFGPLCYGLLPNGILAFWPKSQELILFAFMTNGVQLMTAVFYTWANEIMAGDDDLRALTISSMNGVQYSVSAWLPIIIFPQTMSPTFRRGFPSTFGFVIAGLIIIVIIKLLADRDARRRRINQDVEDNSGTEEKVPDSEEEDKKEVEVLGKDQKD
ncbi:related to transporter protein [Armillaria ostoyae]|uniref:Related to transporter protein n=1 Tax=Armillaria ostoyae TaxID=47428 RepID=A0A284RAU3_ARMOS|nr:related to transporter protein [Armillaria ostoyae]